MLNFAEGFPERRSQGTVKKARLVHFLVDLVEKIGRAIPGLPGSINYRGYPSTSNQKGHLWEPLCLGGEVFRGVEKGKYCGWTKSCAALKPSWNPWFGTYRESIHSRVS